MMIIHHEGSNTIEGQNAVDIRQTDREIFIRTRCIFYIVPERCNPWPHVATRHHHAQPANMYGPFRAR